MHQTNRLNLLIAAALASLPGIAVAQQYNLQRSNSIDLSTQFLTGSNFGTNPLSLAFDATSNTAWVGGYFGLPGVGNIGVVRVGDALATNAAAAGLDSSTFSTSAFRGINHLATFGGDVFVSHVNPETQPSFVRRINGTTGATVWNVDNPAAFTNGATALEIDPRGAGTSGSGTFGLGFMTQSGSGGGQRHVLDLNTGSLLYGPGGALGGGAGVFSTAGQSNEFGNRDIDFDAQGNFLRSTARGFDYAVRTGDTSFQNTFGSAGSYGILQKRDNGNTGFQIVQNDVGQSGEFFAGVGTSQFVALSARISGAPNPLAVPYTAADPFAFADGTGNNQLNLDARQVHFRNIDGTTTGLTTTSLVGDEDFFTGGFTSDIKQFASGVDANGFPVLMVLSFAERRLDIYQVEPTWIAGSGDWDTAGNWAYSLIGNGGTQNARFNQQGAATTVTLNSAKTSKLVKFDSTNSYTISGTGTLTLDAPDGKAANIAVLQGSHTIAVPVIADNGTDLRVPTGSTLTLSGGISGAGMTKRDGGTAVVKNFRLSAASFRGGTVRIAPHGGNPDDGASRAELQFPQTVPGTYDGTLDITNNGVIDPVTPLADVKAALLSGRAGGTWTGGGLTSSTAAANSAVAAVGYGLAGDIGATTFLGQTVAADDVIVRYTRLGDANLSGTTNITDFALLAANFNIAGGWTQGDFNYDDLVNISDFSLLAANFNQSAPGDLPRAAVPEPASVGIVLGAAALLSLRRRK